MIKEREDVIAKIHLAVQVGLSVGAFLLSCRLYNYLFPNSVIPSLECISEVSLSIPLWFLLLGSGRLNYMLRETTNWGLLRDYVKVTLMGTVLFYIISILLGIGERALVFWILFYIIDLGILFSSTILFYRSMRFLRRQEFNTKQILIIADEKSKGLIDNIIKSKDWGYEIHGIFTDSEEIIQAYQAENIISPGKKKLAEIIDNHAVDEVFYCKGSINEVEIEEYIGLCAEVGVIFRIKTSLELGSPVKSKFSLFRDTPIFSYGNVPDDYVQMKVKRAFDIVFSLIVIILGSPVFFIIAFLIKLEDGGPVFFIQRRVGLNGRYFNCFKFRTMVVDAEALQQNLIDKNEQEGPVFKIKMDPRITRPGRFLRKSSLDELPQFFNVLIGEMSIVGPRPPIPAEVKQYQRWQNRRLSMKPGITCIWQVSGRNNISFDEWMRLDLRYIDNWSLALDLRIVIKTIKVMLVGDGQ